MTDSNHINPHSSIPGSVFPAMVQGRGAHVMALDWQLQQSQWWKDSELHKHQMKQLSCLLAHAWEHLPWYKDRLSSTKYNPSRKLTDAVFSRIPILTRQDIQQHEVQLLNRNYPKEHGKTHSHHTSGSTARPIKVVSTQASQLFQDTVAIRDHNWHQRDLSGHLAAIRFVQNNNADFPDGLNQQGWGGASDAIYQSGRSSLLSVETPVKQQLDWLRRQNPDYFLTYPSNLQAILSALPVGENLMPSLQQVRTIGETVDDDLRKHCARILNAPLIDLYSAQEIGAMAVQCPQGQHYHHQSEVAYIEVLRSNGTPCKPGETGRVVVTPLHNFAMPLIRYDIGDYAEVGEPCSCGRGLPTLQRIMGRTRNMLRIPSGDYIWPRLGVLRYAEETGAPIEQVQVVQTHDDHLELRIVVEGGLSADQESTVSSILLQSVGHPFSVSFSYPSEIMRSKSGKFEEFIRQL